MFSPRRTALYVAIGAMAFAAGEASAATTTCRIISGTSVCSPAYSRGSEQCDVASSGPFPLLSATCSITGFNFIDGAEGASGTTGAYCASGAAPPGLCTPAAPAFSLLSSASTAISAAGGADRKKPKDCKPKHGGKHGGKHDGKPVGHDDSCVDIIIGGGGAFLSADAPTPVCTEPTPGTKVCTTSATIGVPDGSFCANGQPAGDFTASDMLAITEVCVDDGYGTCDTFYQHCTVDPTSPVGTPYDCVDITDQAERCDAYGPLDPYCGTPKPVNSCGD